MTATPAQRFVPTRLERLIVTRPTQDAATWVEALRGEGWPAQALPLIAIAEPADTATRQLLWHWRRHWLDADAIMFVSAAAVQHFFSGHVSRPTGAGVRTRFWAPGPGTARVLAQALARLGIGADRVDAPPADAAQFDSEALWPVVVPQLRAGLSVLIVRGQSLDAPTVTPVEQGVHGVAGNGRDWLIQQCEAAGAHIDGCVAYERRAPVWTPAEQALVSAASTAGSVWLFSSSEALAHLRASVAQPAWSQASALVTHPRIAATAREAGFGRVMETRPALPDVLRALESGWSRP